MKTAIVLINWVKNPSWTFWSNTNERAWNPLVEYAFKLNHEKENGWKAKKRKWIWTNRQTRAGEFGERQVNAQICHEWVNKNTKGAQRVANGKRAAGETRAKRSGIEPLLHTIFINLSEYIFRFFHQNREKL